MTTHAAKRRPLLQDPTRTTSLRRQFIADMDRRFAAISKAIVKLVVDEDIFGLVDRPGPIFNKRWEFQTDGDKVASFRKWLKEQVDGGLLQVDAKHRDKPWTAPYVESAYKKGLLRAYQDTHADKLRRANGPFVGSQAQFLASTFAQAEQSGKIQLIHTRSYDSLTNVSAVMAAGMTRVLAQGLSQGKGPREIASTLTKEVDKISKSRARAIARTEIVHAHAEGQLDTFEALGKDVEVMAEWNTAGDDHVCEVCAALEGTVLEVKQARGMLPRHPNCRCAWIPANVGEKAKGQKVGAAARQAIRDSVAAEFPNETVEDGLRRTRWLGADQAPVESFTIAPAPAPQLWNNQPTAVVRWMGKAGWTYAEAKKVLEDMGVPIADATLRIQLRAGVTGDRGTPAALLPDQVAELNQRRLGMLVPPPKVVVPPPPPPVDGLTDIKLLEGEGGRGKVYTAKLDGKKVVYKPDSQVAGDPRLNGGTPSGDEYAARLVDKAWGTNVMMETRLINGPHGVGVVKDWATGVPLLPPNADIEDDDIFDQARMRGEKVDARTRTRSAMMSFLIGDIDTEPQNVIVDGKNAKQIDLGGAWARNDVYAARRNPSHFATVMGADAAHTAKMDPTDAANLKRMLEDPNLRKELAKHISAGPLEDMYARGRVLLAHENKLGELFRRQGEDSAAEFKKLLDSGNAPAVKPPPPKVVTPPPVTKPKWGVEGVEATWLASTSTDTQKLLIEKYGKDVLAELGTIVGAQPGAELKLGGSTGKYGTFLTVEVAGKDGAYKARRQLSIDGHGQLSLHNLSFFVKDKGEGLGSLIFAQQVEATSRLGFTKIECLAGGGPTDKKYNGYYTWPRLGYDTDWPPTSTSASTATLAEWKARWPDARHLSDIMVTEEGREWWKANGKQFVARFDLSKNSTSMKVLGDYVQRKAETDVRFRATADALTGGRGDIGPSVVVPPPATTTVVPPPRIVTPPPPPKVVTPPPAVVVPPPVVTDRPAFGDSATSYARALGKEGYTFDEAKRALNAAGIQVADATLRIQVRAGATGQRGAPATLTQAQRDFLLQHKAGALPPPRVVPPRVPPAAAAATSPKAEPAKVSPPPKTGLETKPEHITFTGKPTEFTLKAWEYINREMKGARTPGDKAKAAARIGNFMRQEVLRRNSSGTGAKVKEVEQKRAVFMQLVDLPVADPRRVAARQAWHDAATEMKEALRNAPPPPVAGMKPEGVTLLQVMSEVRDMGAELTLFDAPGTKPGIVKARPEEKKAVQDVTKLFPKDWGVLHTRTQYLQVNVEEGSNRAHMRSSAQWPTEFDPYADDPSITEYRGRPTRAQRSRILRSEKGSNSIHFPPEWDEKTRNVTAAHELMHSFQYALARKGMGDIEDAYALSRLLPNEKAVPLYPGSTTDFGFRDKWANAYSGRVHNMRSSGFHEIATMSTQALFFNGPGDADEDQQNFTLGLLMSL